MVKQPIQWIGNAVKKENRKLKKGDLQTGGTSRQKNKGEENAGISLSFCCSAGP